MTPFPESKSTTIRGKRAQDVYFKVYEAKQKTYSDQIGRFPFHSQRGYKYIMVMVEINWNATHVTALNNRTDAEIQRAYLIILNRINQTGITPQCLILDNDCSENMKTLIQINCALKLVPPICRG